MKTLTLSSKAQSNLKKYITNYRGYFFELYSDTGIGSEEIILENYRKESINREKELELLLQKRLSPDIVIGRTLVNSLMLPWRSKVIFITWEDQGDDVRRIVDLEIR